MNKAATVYLADLRHDYCGIIANDCMPLGVAYMKAVMDRDVPEVESRLFAYPERLLAAIRERPPDVLMLSNYCWNEALSLHVAKLAKRRWPDTFVVLGGPNLPLEPDRQCGHLEAHPEIDLYAMGEGDFLAAEILRHFLESGASKQPLGEREIPSSIYRRPDRTVVRTAPWERHKHIDEIPSPWLTGIMDEFFDGRLAPILETNRGCPFSCTYCSQGSNWYTKVHYFSLERLREEIFYIARRIRQHSPLMRTLRLADSNYGMYERDAEISGYLGETQKLHGWPTYIDATTGKNRPDRIIKSIEKVSGAMLLYQAVQSLDEDVLRNVKRSNIRMEAYEQLRVYVRGRGLRSNTDLILGLPGETLKSHVDGLRKILDAGLSRVTNFQLMMLKGTELEKLEVRRMFRLRTGHRILPKNFGVYGGEKVFDSEEIVCETDALPFEDYLAARRVALACAFLWLDTYFDEVVAFAESLGLKRSEWFDAVFSEMESPSGGMRAWLDDFTAETRNELFSDREACVEFYSREDNFERLLQGEIGDNLIHKYRAIASFHIWAEACACVMRATRNLIRRRNRHTGITDFDGFWSDLHRYIELRHACGKDKETILASKGGSLQYDVAAWLAAGSPNDPKSFRMPAPMDVEFRLDDDSAGALQEALEMWTDHPKGLTKIVARLQVGTQNREARVIRHAEAGLS